MELRGPLRAYPDMRGRREDRCGASRSGVVEGIVVVLLASACGGTEPLTSGPQVEDDGVFCTVPSSELHSALVPEAIPALEDPPLVSPDHPEASYVDDHERVIGILLDGRPVAIPLNLIRHHEIVNFSGGTDPIAVSYCPLTGSSLVFDRSAVDGVPLGVSGLLHANNLVLYDREDPASFFTQMKRGEAVCGPGARNGTRMELRPFLELRWDAWKRLHPETLVVSNDPDPAVDRGSYDVNVHEEYERIDNPFVIVLVEMDPRRAPKERVFGVPVSGDGGPVFPFGELGTEERRAIAAVSGTVVVFWDRSAEAVAAFDSELDGRSLAFTATDSGYVDLETGSSWRIDGLAVSGPLEGRRLEQRADAFVSFWFAWAFFFPETVIWEN